MVTNGAAAANVKGLEKQPYPLSREVQRLFLSKLLEQLVKVCGYAPNTGCREQAICQLKWTWMREKHGTHYVSLPSQVTKNGRSRPIVLNSAVRNLLSAIPARSNYVFTYKDAAVKKMQGSAWQRAWKQAGLPISSGYRKGVHNLPHTVAQRLRDDGVPEWTVRSFLGHSGESVTEVYATPTLRELLEAGERLCRGAKVSVVGVEKYPL